MNSKSAVLCSFGGDTYHLPSDSVEACVTSHVEGADIIRICVQPSKDGIPIIYSHSDISATTEGKGKVNDLTWGELYKLDAGYKFRMGKDFPWRKWMIEGRRYPKRHHHLTRFESLVNALENDVSYALQFSETSPDNPTWKPLVVKCLNILDRVGAERVILCSNNASHLDLIRKISNEKLPLGLVIDSEGSSERLTKKDKPDYVFLPWKTFNELEGEIRETIANECRLIASVPVDVDEETIARIMDVAYGVESQSIMKLSLLVRGSRIRFLDEFNGKNINRDNWVVGVSSGYTGFTKSAFHTIDDRGKCEVKIFQNDALIIEVDEGYQYASAAAVTRFSVGGDFSVEFSSTYENPQRATELVMCALNSTVFPIYHREGEITHVRVEDEHPAFDAHGLCPYVSVEREEADGTRIMHNASFSEFINLRQTNFYRHDVGAGDSKIVELRMARRGRFFTGHYKDEKNPEWIGLGYVENNSMNDRVYLRLSGKHYPKRQAPDPLPWNRFSSKRFCIKQPRS